MLAYRITLIISSSQKMWRLKLVNEALYRLYIHLCESFEISFKHVPVGKWYPISLTMYRANISILWGVPPMQTNCRKINFSRSSFISFKVYIRVQSYFSKCIIQMIYLYITKHFLHILRTRHESNMV